MSEPVNKQAPLAAAPTGLAARALAAASRPSYLDRLNPEQREAVETLDGPVLVLAGAGTGKTRVLTTRIAHILSLGRARPAEILAVTFTNKAAREMTERIGDMIGDAVEGMPWLGTFHAIGVRMLRRHAELVGLSSNFTILDTDDQTRLMKQLIQAADIDEERWPARHLARVVDGWKNRGLPPEKVSPGEASAFAEGLGIELYEAYQARLSTLNAVDFGDLLLHTIRLFQEHTDVLDHYQRRFRFILVDEYQDTNVAQYLWLRLLAQRDRNICCVGDDDQSIYGWRGAEVDNILRFETDFPGARVIRLERNYRSTGHILAAASHLIAHNTSRLGKTLRAVGDAGEKVTVTAALDSPEEARLIGEEVEQLQRHGHSLNEMAILVRASFQTREFEDRFATLGVPLRLIGGTRFHEREEIRDAIAYLRCIVSDRDDLAFERIVNVPRRGLGEATVRSLHGHGRAADLSLMASARAVIATGELRPQVRGALRDLIAAFDRWRGQLATLSPPELAAIVLDESGYTGMWQQERSPDAPGRLENLRELVQSMERFESVRGFLEHVSLVMDVDRDAGAEAVSIMTLHSAKGLEFDTVFLPGWEEGLLPHLRALTGEDRSEGLEEERRLAHVGLTRARQRASIYFATRRRGHGSWSETRPSRFIDELPEAAVEVTGLNADLANWGNVGGSRFDDVRTFGSTYGTPGWQRARNHGAGGGAPAADRAATAGRAGSWPVPARGRGGRVVESEAVTQPGGVSVYKIGDRVFNLKFGNGNVVRVDGRKLTVAFDKAGEKKVMDGFVERV